MEKNIEIIRKNFIKNGYANKSINYEQFLELYEPYKSEMGEADFAKILKISYDSYIHLKGQGISVIILRERKKVSTERKLEIIQILKKSGYTNKPINYKEFLDLYEPYKSEMGEIQFAELLGISYSIYIRIKNIESKTVILKELKKISKERELEIKQTLRFAGYANKSIIYQDFLEIYEPYKSEIAEEDFAKILGLSYPAYHDLKNINIRRVILKEDDISEELIEEIIKNLETEYSNKLITYQIFLELYEPYKAKISEIKFAEILGISRYSYKKLKNENKKVKILREKNQALKKRKQEIKKILIENGYSNKIINYQVFLSLYEPYKSEMKELDFANVLEMSPYIYNNLKNKGKDIKILKTEKNISEELKEKIRENLIEKGYSNERISYQKFLILYEPYKLEIKEADFAEIIGISYSNYMSMKVKGTKTKILKSKEQISEEEKENIRQKLIQDGYANKTINYQEFSILYEPYKTLMSEENFAIILEIPYYTYCSLKNHNKNTKILKFKNNISEELKEKIRENLKKEGYSNKLINYNKFLELYEPYRTQIKETDFAELLGISASNYHNLKFKNTNAKIKFNYQELNRIKYKLNLQSREYKKEELEEICRKNNITLYELILELYPNVNIQEWMNKPTIYIGICQIPKPFLEKYSDELMNIMQELIKTISKRYPTLQRYKDDVASTALLYIIEKKGALVKNSKTDEEALIIIKKYMSKVIKYQYIAKYKINSILSLDENITSDKKRTRYDVLKSPKAEVVIEVDKKPKKNAENILDDMEQCFQEGMQNSQAIMYVREKYKLTRQELLKILEEELRKKRKIAKTADGKMYLGEEYDD